MLRQPIFHKRDLQMHVSAVCVCVQLCALCACIDSSFHHPSPQPSLPPCLPVGWLSVLSRGSWPSAILPARLTEKFKWKFGLGQPTPNQLVALCKSIPGYMTQRCPHCVRTTGPCSSRYSLYRGPIRQVFKEIAPGFIQFTWNAKFGEWGQ